MPINPINFSVTLEYFSAATKKLNSYNKTRDVKDLVQAMKFYHSLILSLDDIVKGSPYTNKDNDKDFLSILADAHQILLDHVSRFINLGTNIFLGFNEQGLLRYEQAQDYLQICMKFMSYVKNNPNLQAVVDEFLRIKPNFVDAAIMTLTFEANNIYEKVKSIPEDLIELKFQKYNELVAKLQTQADKLNFNTLLILIESEYRVANYKVGKHFQEALYLLLNTTLRLEQANNKLAITADLQSAKNLNYDFRQIFIIAENTVLNMTHSLMKTALKLNTYELLLKTKNILGNIAKERHYPTDTLNEVSRLLLGTPVQCSQPQPHTLYQPVQTQPKFNTVEYHRWPKSPKPNFP